MGKCVPVVVRAGTFFAKTQSELYCLTGLLTLIADYFRQLPDVDLPMETGTFTETAEEFVLAAPAGDNHYDKLRVPRAIAFQERE